MCGFIGMMIATYSNTRTAIAAEKGLNDALSVSFTSGSVMGLTVVSVGLGSLSALLMAFNENAIDNVAALTGFGMGASTVSIFARVAGGIFTKVSVLCMIHHTNIPPSLDTHKTYCLHVISPEL